MRVRENKKGEIVKATHPLNIPRNFSNNVNYLLALLLLPPRHPLSSALRLLRSSSGGLRTRGGSRGTGVASTRGHVAAWCSAVRRRSSGGSCRSTAEMRRHVATGPTGRLGSRLFLGRLRSSTAGGLLGGLTLSPARSATSARSQVKARSSTFRLCTSGRLWETSFPGSTAGFGLLFALLLFKSNLIKFPVCEVSNISPTSTK